METDRVESECATLENGHSMMVVENGLELAIKNDNSTIMESLHMMQNQLDPFGHYEQYHELNAWYQQATSMLPANPISLAPLYYHSMQPPLHLPLPSVPFPPPLPVNPCYNGSTLVPASLFSVPYGQAKGHNWEWPNQMYSVPRNACSATTSRSPTRDLKSLSTDSNKPEKRNGQSGSNDDRRKRTRRDRDDYRSKRSNSRDRSRHESRRRRSRSRSGSPYRSRSRSRSRSNSACSSYQRKSRYHSNPRSQTKCHVRSKDEHKPNLDHSSALEKQTKDNRHHLTWTQEEPTYKRPSPLEPYYKQNSLLIEENKIVNIIEATDELIALRNQFQNDLLERAERARNSKEQFSFPPRPIKIKPRPISHHSDCNCTNCDSSDSDFEAEQDGNYHMRELERKAAHPWRMHPELWYNEPGELNDGPLCRCSIKAQRSGIRHGIYMGEQHLAKCNPNSNNRDRLYHYVIGIKPQTNFMTNSPTTIEYDGHQYYFEGYSMFSHAPISPRIPDCHVIRFNHEYTITPVEDEFPQNFSIGDLDYYYQYVFVELLELLDLNFKAKDDIDGCDRFHFMPRFVRMLEDKGKEILAMSAVLKYLHKSSKPLIEEHKLKHFASMSVDEWHKFANQHKSFLVTCPGAKPATLRIDQIDREGDDTTATTPTTTANTVHSRVKDSSKNENTIQVNLTNGCEEPESKCDSQNDYATPPASESPSSNNNEAKYPVIVHFGVRPAMLSYAGNPRYQKAWREYIKFRHLLANKEKVSMEDKLTMSEKENKLQEMRSNSHLKRDVTVVVSSKGYFCTGLQGDLVQHTLMLPALVSHLRFHESLNYLEHLANYQFVDRALMQLAMTHPSYREIYGTNPDHARNTLTNCGLRHVEYGDRKVHFMNTRKRGINMLLHIMSRFGCNEETISNIHHNERLEFLGDAVVEFLTTIHLYYLFPTLEEGSLATYRAALVQNQHLAVLAKKLQLEKFMLYAHGSDLCHDLELKHAMANCFEAFMGAVFLDGGIEVADRILSAVLFDSETEENLRLHHIWANYPPHPIQGQYPDGDRHLISAIPRLQELVKFEDQVGIRFKHIRLLARAFTHRVNGFNNLTLGSNQRMEFLGDTVLQLITSEYLYRHFPGHHEGHLSLLRSSLVNNKTQSVVCDDLGMAEFVHIPQGTGYPQVLGIPVKQDEAPLKTKDKADMLEAFMGALYVDKGLAYCRRFCDVCFFPRLEDFIINQDWNDPKSKLQQCCLTLRSLDGRDPDIPIYKVIESKGPTNTRIYESAVYFRDKRLATGKGHSIQEAEMNAAKHALNESKALFPYLARHHKALQRAWNMKMDKATVDKNNR